MRSSFLEKIRELCASWENTPDPDTEEEESEGSLEAFLQRLEEIPSEETVYKPERTSELTTLVNSFDLEELAEFLLALLIEDAQLMRLPIFQSSKYISRQEAAFDWLMNLPYGTLHKAREIFVTLFETALSGKGPGLKSEELIQKIKAISAKNKAGLPYEYLRKMVETGDLSPGLRLDLALLMIRYEEYDLDFSQAERLFTVQQTPYMLPALMAAYLRAGLEGAKRSLRSLNLFDETGFPVRSVELRYHLVYIFQEIVRVFRRSFPSDWREQLTAFIDAELEVENSWLRDLLEEELEVGLKPLMQEAPAEGQRGETLSLQELPSDEQIQQWAKLVKANKKYRAEFYEAVAQQFIKHKKRAAINAKPLLTYLKKETDIELEKEFGKMRIAISIEPYYEVSEPSMGTYSDSGRQITQEREAKWQDFVDAELEQLVESQAACLVDN